MSWKKFVQLSHTCVQADVTDHTESDQCALWDYDVYRLTSLITLSQISVSALWDYFWFLEKKKELCCNREPTRPLWMWFKCLAPIFPNLQYCCDSSREY